MKKCSHVQSYSRKTVIIALSLFVLLTMGVGYSILGNDLFMLGSIKVAKFKCQPDGTLYSVLECAAKNDDLGREYTGAHQDTMSGVGNKAIYHWYAETDEEGTEVQNRNNVIFANYCWQMIRTTDTGGVKLIYNGRPENNQCLDDRGTYIGASDWVWNYLDSYFYYGDSYTYDPDTGTFTLVGNVERGYYSSMLGRYTCRQSQLTNACTYMLYVVAQKDPSSTTYAFEGITEGSHYSQFGTMSFDDEESSYWSCPAFVGFMHGPENTTTYVYPNKESVYLQGYTSTSYYFADSYEYDPETGKYTLIDPFKITNNNDYASLIGKYTIFSSNATATNSNVSYIVDGTRRYLYYVRLSGNNSLESYNTDTYTYGTSYVDNGDGTYTIQDATTFNRFDYYPDAHYAFINNKYVCKNAVDDTCSDLIRVKGASEYEYNYIMASRVIIYANSFTYDSSTNMYTLAGDSYPMWDYYDETNQSTLAHAHYFCYNGSNTCSTLDYVFDVTSSGYMEYVELKGGKSGIDYIDEQLENETNSRIKDALESWYRNHFDSSYETALEDVIYCNNRTTLERAGWNPNGTTLGSYLKFREFNSTTDLSCERVKDRFSVSNPDAPLQYKVGLITSPELVLMNNKNARTTGQRYWTMSPTGAFHPTSDLGGIMVVVSTDGSMSTGVTYGDYGIRPVISLIPGLMYGSGDGSKESPYMITR